MIGDSWFRQDSEDSEDGKDSTHGTESSIHQ